MNINRTGRDLPRLDRFTWLDRFGWAAVALTLAGVFGHGGLRAAWPRLTRRRTGKGA